MPILKRYRFALFFISIGILSIIFSWNYLNNESERQTKKHPLKLYWFIPDGFRADPDTFNIYRWAKEGKLPNIKKLMEQGSYGFSIPEYPGHTPTNFATLLTGTSPRVHGIADGPMHIEGHPLNMVSKGGFRSSSKRVPPIWYTLEENQHLVTLLSVPGSTPPELRKGITIRGRWGGWGIDFPAVIFNSAHDKQLRVAQGPGNRVFYFGPELTKYIAPQKPKDWRLKLPQSYSPVREVILENWGKKIFALIVDSSDDQTENYDTVHFSSDKTQILFSVSSGNWSAWQPIELTYNLKTQSDTSELKLATEFKVKVIKLGKKDFFRIRFFYNNLNKFVVEPSHLADKIVSSLGPMVDFVDNFPPQLIHYPEDKTTFIEEANMSIEWHRKMVDYMKREFNSDVIIHDIYTPNQMLTSRWWLGNIDPLSRRSKTVSPKDQEVLWNEVLNMYKGVDGIIGEILEDRDPNTYIVLSSDHGAVPLDYEVRLNNLFAKKGWLKYQIDKNTGVYTIDWANTKVIYLKMSHVFINPKGLGGNYKRSSGKKYQELRDEVITLIKDLKSPEGESPLDKVVYWENAQEFGLPDDRIGDLIIANKPTFGWIEEITSDQAVFRRPLKTGYKQAILPRKTKAMWTPFMIVGPGVKKGYELKRPIDHKEQYPTIMKLLDQKLPKFVEGKPIIELMKEDK